MIIVDYRSEQVKKSLRGFPELIRHLENVADWLRGHLDIDKTIRLVMKPGKMTGCTRGRAPWPHSCRPNEYEVTLYVNTIFKCANLGAKYADYDHLTSSGMVRTITSILSHEFVHLLQYDEDRLCADYVTGSSSRVRLWMGEEWTGSKGATHKSYLNLPWEKEAFGREGALTDAYFKRRRALDCGKIKILKNWLPDEQ